MNGTNILKGLGATAGLLTFLRVGGMSLEDEITFAEADRETARIRAENPLSSEDIARIEGWSDEWNEQKTAADAEYNIRLAAKVQKEAADLKKGKSTIKSDFCFECGHLGKKEEKAGYVGGSTGSRVRVTQTKAKPNTSGLKLEPYKGPHRTHWTTSRHYGGKRSKDAVMEIILHLTDSEGKSAENTFTDNKSVVSAHYIVEKDGIIVQIVPLNRVAYHCRGRNTNSIGIEYVGKLPDTNKQTLTEKQLTKGLGLVAYLQGEYGIADSEVNGHREYSAKECPGKENLRVMKSILARVSP